MNKKQTLNAISRLTAGYSKEYQKLAMKVANRVIALINKGQLTIEKAVTKALKESDFFRKNHDTLNEKLFQAAAIGFGIDAKIIIPTAKINIISKLNSMPWTGDKTNLSTRLYGFKPIIREKITQTIKASMKEGATVVKLARDLYDGYGYGGKLKPGELPKYLNELIDAAREARSVKDPELIKKLAEAKANIEALAGNGAPTKALKAAYSQLVRAAEDLNQKAINKSIYVATNEVARYYSERIARTEISRAWSEGFYAQTYDDSDVVGYRWDLSSRHPVYDICDFHANADLYGLGRGTYPKDKMPPHPAHPHCMCNLSEVIDGEFDGLKQNDKIDSSGEKYLKSLTEGERDALMGYKGNEAFKRGNGWQDILNNWKGHSDPNPRLARSDFKTKGTA